ncbi:hypothetical protein GZ77_20815 [Endozoicomonas montiporae]|uniref:RING-type domain-containing protein n=2 Tax=Endozoicomonas montiporae TaxID=1027273 RepID=A0A081N361_9GAMM|nr:RING finger domain-containing protein [Endozoicomonas montiporae]AMO58176.1 RING finger and CHY zinc finger domain-containing protein [Endozoicomonas montiporae CL-33]KEQ12884.1 hypothetical protein GZ77_20815 [Endozoicomonas montiporae]
MHLYSSFIALTLFLLAMVAVQLCYSSTIIDRHHTDGYKVRIEINVDTDSRDVSLWQVSLLLPKDFNDRSSILCFKAPVVPADSESIAILVSNDLSNYCYQLVIVKGEQTPATQHVVENSTLVHLKSMTEVRPDPVFSPYARDNEPRAPPITFLVYPDNVTNHGLEAGQTRNNTLAFTGGKPAGTSGLSGGEGGGSFYSPPPPPRGGGGGRPSGLFEIDLIILKPVTKWLMSISKDSVLFEEQPSPALLRITRVNADGSSSEVTIPFGWSGFINTEQLTDVNFWDIILRHATNSCLTGENLQRQPACLKLSLERTILKTNHGSGRKAANGKGEPSGSAADTPDNGSKGGNVCNQTEERGEPEGQEGEPPGRGSGDGNDGSGDGNDGKDNDNEQASQQNTKTRDTQLLANQLVAIIESDEPNAVSKLRHILDSLDMLLRLQVLNTAGMDSNGNNVTPVKAILRLQRSDDENSLRNGLIQQLIEATSKQPAVSSDQDISELQQITQSDQLLPEAVRHKLSISREIVLDIIHKINQPGQKLPLGDFEKRCFAEYFIQLLLYNSSPIESIRERLEEISNLAIRHNILFSATSFTLPTTTFADASTKFQPRLSFFDELQEFLNQLSDQMQFYLPLEEGPEANTAATRRAAEHKETTETASTDKPDEPVTSNADIERGATGYTTVDPHQPTIKQIWHSSHSSNKESDITTDKIQKTLNTILNCIDAKLRADYFFELFVALKNIPNLLDLRLGNRPSLNQKIDALTDEKYRQSIKASFRIATSKELVTSKEVTENSQGASVSPNYEHLEIAVPHNGNRSTGSIHPEAIRKAVRDAVRGLQNHHPREGGNPPQTVGSRLRGDAAQDKPRGLYPDFVRRHSVFACDSYSYDEHSCNSTQAWTDIQISDLSSQLDAVRRESQSLEQGITNLRLLARNDGQDVAITALWNKLCSVNCENHLLEQEIISLPLNQAIAGDQTTEIETLRIRLNLVNIHNQRLNQEITGLQLAIVTENEEYARQQSEDRQFAIGMQHEYDRMQREYDQQMRRNDTYATSDYATSNGGENGPSHSSRLTATQTQPQRRCEHYNRKCHVSFSCCGRFYACHRCHNDSPYCENDDRKALDALNYRCSVCFYECEITENSQKCGLCYAKMANYFCKTCKHYTDSDKNPYHCEKCGICRINKGKSFHCDVCNVCLDNRLKDNHKCRPGSGHDECGICLEDAFSGCQILPCSHKVHKECVIAMIQHGIRTCPVCRQPLYPPQEGHGQDQ